MKVRIGYVSNSSSSSFCLWGVCLQDVLNKDEIYDFENELYKKIKIRNMYSSEVSKVTTCNGISNYSEEDVFIGYSPVHQKDDETLLQFKQRVCSELNSYGLNIEVNQIELYVDGGYDG